MPRRVRRRIAAAAAVAFSIASLEGARAIGPAEQDDIRARGALAADAPLPVYGPDRADLRNRLFHAFFTSPVDATIEGTPAAPPLTRIEGGPRAAVAWGAAHGAILDDPRYADVLSLLERALEDRALRAQSPLHRVLFQHDLWTAHDTLFARRESLGGAGERRLARCDRLLSLLARAVARFAPREDEIAALPATPLPSGIGGAAAPGAPAAAHAAACGGRIAFERHATRDPGASALVGRLVAIDARGTLRVTPLVARVEVLASSAPARPASFTLDRAALLARPFDPSALAPIAPDDPAPDLARETPSRFEGPTAYAPRAERCAACHRAGSPALPLPPLPRKEDAPEFAPIRAAFAEREGR